MAPGPTSTPTYAGTGTLFYWFAPNFWALKDGCIDTLSEQKSRGKEAPRWTVGGDGHRRQTMAFGMAVVAAGFMEGMLGEQ